MSWNAPNILTILRLIAAPGLALIFVLFARPAADWIALGIFVGASVTDWFDGYLARKWKQQSRFGAMLDPIADKAMVIIALTVVVGLSGLNPWLLVPASVILFREVFVSGLREFLGADSGKLQVTRLAKWKTTAQMVAITLLFLSLALQQENFWLYRSMVVADYNAQLARGADDWNIVWQVVQGAWITWILGTGLFWIAGILTGITGIDYFVKALPFSKRRTAHMIDVVYFAWVRERIGLPKETVETTAGTVAELVEELKEREARYATAFADLGAIRVATDQRLSNFEASLSGVREVAFFPPMTGG